MERQPDAVRTTVGAKPPDRKRHEKKVVRKIYDEPVCGLLRAFRRAKGAERGLKLFALFFLITYLTYSLVSVNSVRFFITRDPGRYSAGRKK